MNEKARPERVTEANPDIADRSSVFYWQTDRAIEPPEVGRIWADRHAYFSDDELLRRTQQALKQYTVEAIKPLDATSQTNLGNVNSVRTAVLNDGTEVIIRCHPKGIKNGYFHVESLVANKTREAHLPSYTTLAIHDNCGNPDDFAFQIIEKLPGTAVQKWLEGAPEDETKLLHEIGKTMARIHQIEVEDFGPFNNDLAKNGKLVGLHSNFREAAQAALPDNLDTLERYGTLNKQQAAAVTELFTDNPLLNTEKATLVHNDFADWNILTDGQKITGILDWDECVGGVPESDIACWSTFFSPERLEVFLEGYFSVAEKSDNFEELFELMRLRYVISKMTLRLQRYSWDPSDFVRNNIENGKKHLAESMKYFNL